MLKIVEAFSGIGAQREALEKAKIEFEIVNTIEWDVNAIYAYDKMHNSNSVPSDLKKEEILKRLSNITLSPDGKIPYKNGLKRMKENKLQNLYAAIIRNRNLCDITKVKGEDIETNLDVLTYSFPCQDLSIAKNFQNSSGAGIEKGSGTRSGLLWEVERILLEMKKDQRELPKFLLMENVNAITSPKHNKNFEIWKNQLESMGYSNRVYKLDASKFGVPQSRKRTFMLSIHIENLDDDLNFPRLEEIDIKSDLKDFLRIGKFPEEDEKARPNFTASRKKISEENKHLYADGFSEKIKLTNTISTKQDRNPNAGVIWENKNMRYLTPRECFLLMGFPENKYEKLVKANMVDNYFTNAQAWKMAGNSIVVNVLVEIFKVIEEMKREYFDK
ncbi:DNA (cytosine-5-)-methyltransferase [Lactococcus lactis]|uniref:DNA (cytosine-5-)-methyltransferase n=1 Tax=Lactococcus lactis TaxID=1358 RepID=UPI0024A91F4C|nr:DNA (cytosine-5-)-methyltransferase [Lactococcus lactis]